MKLNSKERRVISRYIKSVWEVKWISNGMTHVRCFQHELLAQQFCNDLYNECLISASVEAV